MTSTNFRSAAFAILALGAGLATAPSFAQDRFAATSDEGAAYAQPIPGDEGAAVPPNTMGHFTCGFNEQHSHLERQNCGGVHYRY